MENVATNILNKNLKNINNSEVDLIPCNTGVLVEFYDDNPYRHIETDDSGIVWGVESTKKYKSTETGEMEDTEEYISVAKVIAVGPFCKNVKVGEDVYCVKYLANPVPFRNKRYRCLDEQNIMLRAVNKE